MTIRTSYVASALLLSLLLSRPAVAGDTPPAAIGKAAPTFSVADETGKVHRLERYRGKLVVLEWTNPGCPFVKRHVAETLKALLAGKPAPASQRAYGCTVKYKK